MTLIQLRIVLLLGRTHSMSLCAQILGVSKANVSTSLSNLEKELGVKLFFRLHKGSYLTPMGERVFEHAERIWQEYEAIQEGVHGTKEATSTDSVKVLYPNAQNYFIRQYLDIITDKTGSDSIRLTSTSAPHLSAPETICDSDLIGGSILNEDFDLLDRYKYEFIIYATHESPLTLLIDSQQLPADMEHEIADSDLKKFKLVVPVNLLTEDKAPANMYSRYFKRHKLEKKLDITECNSLPMIKHYLNRGYALMYDEYNFERNFDERFVEACSLQLLKIKPEETVTHYLMINKQSQYFESISEALVSMFNKAADDFPQIKRID